MQIHLFKSINEIKRSNLFDPEFFKLGGEKHSAWSHLKPMEMIYLTEERLWGKRVSAYFDGQYYLEHNDDVKKSNVNPLLHFIRNGFFEGRNPCVLINMDFLVSEVLGKKGLTQREKTDFLSKFPGLHELLQSTECNVSPFFDFQFFKSRYPELEHKEILSTFVSNNGLDPKTHSYYEVTPYLSLNEYIDLNKDVKKANKNPLEHLLQYGLKEKRQFASRPVVDPHFLKNTAELFANPGLLTLEGYVESNLFPEHLAGPFWKSDYSEKTFPAIKHRAHDVQNVFIGIVLFENKEKEIKDLLTSIQREIETSDHKIRYKFFVNDKESLGNYEKWIGKDFLKVTSDGNVGFGQGHNALMKEAFNENQIYIGANPDGFFLPNCVSNLVNFSDFYDNLVMLEAPSFPIDHPKWFDPISFDTNWVSGACFSYPQKLWETIGGFDPNIHLYCEDVDLSWRVKLGGGQLKVCPTAEFVHDVTDRFLKKASKSEAYHRRYNMLRGLYYLCAKWGNEEKARKTLQILKDDYPERVDELNHIGPIFRERTVKNIANFDYERFSPSRFW